ncbi:transcription-repair coupling factor [Liquorilactobacillus aquaticus DSM 21051]|uniref:Transcription-repair-coupling factor n=1 Tax=Liquorilactobacillus aquaticus DSM 21051 TaxID=1423725 RepID=A0A0R2CWL1_9LACO|nr:transcription-repair coupling factor [Liquorilactobacillus aquaticus]KRM96237.1 transcription-repair coupling factor [Liquorilactobacillus aquaticus DSM 21051]
MKLEDLMLKIPETTEWIANIDPAESARHLVTGLLSSSKTIFLAGLFAKKQKTMLVVTDTLHHAEQVESDLKGLVGEKRVFLFPVEEAAAAQTAISSPEFKSSRVQALDALCSAEKPQIIVTSTSGLRRMLPPADVWSNSRIRIETGCEIELKKLPEKLSAMGYQRHNLVDKPGDFAIRGSIIDIFPLNCANPIRIDLFDEEVDSIREFDAADQRSIRNIAQFVILPAKDLIVTSQMSADALNMIREVYKKELSRIKDDAQKKLLTRHYEQIVADLKENQITPAELVHSELLFPQKSTLLDYLSEEDLLFVDDYQHVLETQKSMDDEEDNWTVELLKKGAAFSGEKWTLNLHPLIRDDKHNDIFMTLFQKGMGGLKFKQKLELTVRTTQQFFGQMPLLKTEMDRWSQKKQTVIVVVSEEERLTKILQTLNDFKIPAVMTEANALQPSVIQIVQGDLAGGFEIPEGRLVVLTEHELFKKIVKRQVRHQTMDNTERLKSYTELKKGDYVVHVNHGIGRFMGMKTMLVSGKHQDYLTVKYRDDAKLFIPVSQIDRIQKYVSSESKTPHINKLGGSEWGKTKKSVASKIEDIADDLVELYAQRKEMNGYAFSKDNDYQSEFEDAFPYPETPDQLRSSTEIKHDMEQKQPMDRLLIGDVGYGKTEVALRAAFKAVQDGKQVAFLVPTTVLAQQHYETMMNRFEGFPVNVGILSRFRSKKQIADTLNDLKTGAVDIVVGTHRLLSQDVKFADLGLLIVDEEQRFGVKHKERLKELKALVDVLTLTATPIPRTLNMSMLGVRDLSVIETAPMNRYPIQTYVVEQNYGLIVDAVEREMKRGGQVFYLHNRVADIEKVVSELKAMMPEARIGYIHGQMTEVQLERVLFDFIARDYDVLVTTTIIETGVDIPNVNTLIVEDADHMGLAQLYQLRGRVGRSNRVAYAYFMYQQNKVLTEISEKRLEAIKDFTELGSGFKIAMRDLSIRGAGNLLGKQQHGFIDSVGYDLYTQMLKDAVSKKQGKSERPRTDCEINFELEAYLPDSYIDDQRQKIEMYKRIRNFDSKEQYQEVQTDLIDRFGDYPEEVANLLQIGLLKMNADRALIQTITQTKNNVTMTFSKDVARYITAKQLLQAISKTSLQATISDKSGQMQVVFVIQPTNSLVNVLDSLQKIVQLLAQVVFSKGEKTMKVN